MTALRHPVELFPTDPVFVEANHLVYSCVRDWAARGWRCGRCEVGIFILRPGEELPAPGRVCTVCQATVCLLQDRASMWRQPVRVAALVLLGTWPLLLIWALIG